MSEEQKVGHIKVKFGTTPEGLPAMIIIFPPGARDFVVMGEQLEAFYLNLRKFMEGAESERYVQ